MDENEKIEEESCFDKRKKELKEGLILQDDKVVDDRKQSSDSQRKHHVDNVGGPSTKNAFGQKAMVVGGPFARKRIAPKREKDVTGASKRRGIHKIWSDRPIKNVGDGTNTHDVRKRTNDNE